MNARPVSSPAGPRRPRVVGRVVHGAHDALVSGAVALLVACLLTGCSAFVWLVDQRPDRSDEADTFRDWLAGQPGVESVALTYVRDNPGEHADAMTGSVTVTAGTDVPALLESVRTQYVTVLPDAMDLDLAVDASLPFSFGVALGARGPSTDTTRAALEQGRALEAVAGRIDVRAFTDKWERVPIDEISVEVRVEADDPSTVLAAAEATLPLLDDALPVRADVAGGAGDGAVRVGIQSDRRGAACLGPAVDATLRFVAAEPTTHVALNVGEHCNGSLTVPLDDESLAEQRVAEVTPPAREWATAMRPLAGDRVLDVTVGTRAVDLG